MKCWGRNEHGMVTVVWCSEDFVPTHPIFQVGDGTITTPRLTPVGVVNLGDPVVSLELGGVRLSPLPEHRHGFEMVFGLMNNAVSFVRFASRRGCEMLGLQFQRRGDAEFCFLYCICDFFQIGDGSNVNRNAPVAVSGLGSGVIGLALGWVSSSDLEEKH